MFISSPNSLEFLLITMTYIWLCYLCTEMLKKCIMFNDKNMLSKHTKHYLWSKSQIQSVFTMYSCVYVQFDFALSGWYISDVCDGSVTAQFLHNPLAWWLSSKRKLTTDSVCTNVNFILQMLDVLWKWSKYWSWYFKIHWDLHGSSLQAVMEHCFLHCKEICFLLCH